MHHFGDVIGDGQSTIRQLVDEVNKDPRRGYGHEKVLTRIDIDDHTEKMLARRGMTADSVPPKDEVVYLKATANLSTGGTATDVTEVVHPYNVFMAERISRIIDLDICGIDIMTDDITQPLTETGGAVLELYKQGALEIEQFERFGDLTVSRRSNGFDVSTESFDDWNEDANSAELVEGDDWDLDAEIAAPGPATPVATELV